MGVNKLNSLIKEMTETAGISVKTNHRGTKTLVQKLQDNDVPPNQVVEITGHKNLQSNNNYSSLKERQIKNISKILSSSTTYCQQYNTVFKVTLLRHIHRFQPLKTHSKQCFKEIIWLEVFSLSIWHRLKIQSQVQNWGRKRKKAKYNWVIAAVEAKNKLVLNLKVTLSNSGLLILCIFTQAHNKVIKLQKRKS